MSFGVHVGSGLVGEDELAVVRSTDEVAVDVDKVVQTGRAATQHLLWHRHVTGK